jgi:hypothetical protein
MLLEGGMVGEAVGDAGLERLEEQRSKSFLISLRDLKHLLGGLQRLLTERIADLGEDDFGGGGGIETKFDGHAGRGE